MTNTKVLSTELLWTGSGHECLWQLSMTPVRANASVLLHHCWTMNIPHFSGAFCMGSMSKHGTPKDQMARKTLIPLSSSNSNWLVWVSGQRWIKVKCFELLLSCRKYINSSAAHSARNVGFELSAFVLIDECSLQIFGTFCVFLCILLLAFATTDATVSVSKLFATV